MKSYTDLSQSKKLAEILPLESADMIYMPMMDIESMSNSGFFNIPQCYSFNEFKDINSKPLPCWSLAALLNILPSSTLDSSDDHHYRLYCNGKFTEWHDNPIDCCIAMIDRLHEQMVYDFNNS